MTKKEKRLALLCSCPENMSYSDLIAAMADLGVFQLKTNGGSHLKFRGNGVQIILPVHNGDCASCYKKQVSDQLKSKGLL
jgi:hypothetical protein